MAEQKSSEERIAELDKRIEQIKAQKKAIIQREKQVERNCENLAFFYPPKILQLSSALLLKCVALAKHLLCIDKSTLLFHDM